MSVNRLATLLFLTGILLQFCPQAKAQFLDEAKWVPAHANCLILVNADQIYSSNIAQRENWAAERQGAFEQGLTIVPANAGKVMLASQMDFKFMDTVWTVGIFSKMKSDQGLAKLAAQAERELEKLGVHDALELPGDVYAVQLEEGTLGVMAPANRQSTVRWLRDGDSGLVRMSQYLSDAAKFADRNADLIIAFDLDHVISLDDAKSQLLKMEGLRASNINELAEAISKLTGVTLGVTVRDNINGSLKIDFEAGAKGVDRISKNMLLEILAHNGVMINDCLDWNLSTNNNQIIFSGPMSPTGLRKISSLVNQPIRAQFTGTGTTNSQEAVSIGKSTRHYLDSIDLYFRELDEFVNGPKHSTSKAYARWFDKYANKVDALSPSNVDPDVLEYGGQVAEGLREVSYILYGAEASASSRTAAETENRGVNYYGYNYGYGYGYRSRSMSSYRDSVRTQEYAKASTEAKGVMDQLRGGLGELRRQLASKYSDF
jgi:hypothetical protein